MMRKFQKGLAIFLILCLLVNGAAAHGLSSDPIVKQAIKEAFDNCVRANEGDASFLGMKWFAVNDTDNDVMMGRNWVGVVSLRVCYDHSNNVYRCCVKDEDDTLRRITYFEKCKLWYDQDAMVYFDLTTDFFYAPPNLPYSSRGLYGYLDADEHDDYHTITARATTGIWRFKAKMNEVGWTQLTKAINDTPVLTWDLPW